MVEFLPQCKLKNKEKNLKKKMIHYYTVVSYDFNNLKATSREIKGGKCMLKKLIGNKNNNNKNELHLFKSHVTCTLLGSTVIHGLQC